MRLFDSLASYRGFVVYSLQPGKTPGKLDKIPIWPVSGHRCNWMDPSAWMLPYDAFLAAETLGVGYGVGLVLIPNCGLLFIDLDSARDATGGWLPHVAAFEEIFRGAYCETSVSRTGRHILARVQTALLPAHGTRNASFRLEAYSHARFMAIGAQDVSGSLELDFTAVAQRWLAQYFPPSESPQDGEWRETPVDAWHGPTDDEELIRRACRSASPRAVWGAGAAFQDLWAGDSVALERAFPAQSGNQSYGYSEADQALANHLAFWTGNHCPRMEKLMKQSGLARDKHSRPDYMRRTIVRACASQTEWYSGGNVAQTVHPSSDVSVAVLDGSKPVPFESVSSSRLGHPQAIAGNVGSKPSTDSIQLKPGELPDLDVHPYLNMTLAEQHFAGYVYIQDINRIMDHMGFLCDKEQFDNVRKNHQWPMEIDGSKPSDSAWDCLVGNKIRRFPWVRSQYFQPRDLPRHIRRTPDGATEINSYVPLNIRTIAGDATPLIQHVQRLLPHDWELMIYTLAARVQFQGCKFMWAPFLQGVKGNGKTLLAKILEYCIGQRYVHWPKADQLDEKYNKMFVGCILAIVDEMEKFPRDIEPVLNAMVTATRMEIRAMQTDKVMRDVCFNVLFISNDQTSLRCDPDQRRYGPFFCAQQHVAHLKRDGLTEQYFIWFRDWLENRDGFAICAHYLATLNVPDAHRPDVSIRAPQTSATFQAHHCSRTPAEQDILAAVEECRPGFRNGWLSSHAADMVWAQAGRTRHLPINARRQIIEGLGYVPHPGLAGVANGLLHTVLPDGSRPRIYLREDHPWNVAHLNADQIRTGYLEAQK